jgi:gas vesicle protein
MKRRGDWLGHAALGFGVGALVGATLALFLTPRSGNELREDLSERGRRVMQKGREIAEQYTSTGPNQTRPQS